MKHDNKTVWTITRALKLNGLYFPEISPSSKAGEKFQNPVTGVLSNQLKGKFGKAEIIPIVIIVSGFMSPKLQDISREHCWLFYIIPAALNTTWQSGNDETWIYDCTLPSCNFLFLIIIINYCNLFGFIQKPTSWVGLVPNKLNSTLPWFNVGKW